jgi:hypothetical protein
MLGGGDLDTTPWPFEGLRRGAVSHMRILPKAHPDCHAAARP